ncbi:MAG: hypothetical protein ETSY1_28715 [Candidatus Entotheonella factor]|uniref:DUF6748 domain-containing protein n=1 Tax=Entotheonella factor TaxID=1429438 RepID=W4LD33_ENTF1|nr:DUF6748 domain-containing protein [Candidatus Entotheonella palauensis]ETW95897.1 MAG: hypothetical protein ETSY1_28715 [Candidatus Entotheonella factor]
MHLRLSILILFVLLSSLTLSGAQSWEAPSLDADAYYLFQPDALACLSQPCSGGFVQRVNHAMTPCVGGPPKQACPVASVDYSELSLSDTEYDQLLQAVEAGKVLFKGRIKPQITLDLNPMRDFVVSEAWIAASDEPATGTYYRVAADSSPCLFPPCPAYHEAQLNRTQEGYIDDVNFILADAPEYLLDQAMEALTQPDGLLVAGFHAIVHGLDGKQLVLMVSQFYLRLLSDACEPTGCSGQICAATNVLTNCEWKPAYACYQSAVCERQVDGQCGWTETPELLACLDQASQ